MAKKSIKISIISLGIALCVCLISVIGVSAAIRQSPLLLSLNMTTGVKCQVYLNLDGDYQTTYYIFDNSATDTTSSQMAVGGITGSSGSVVGNTIDLTEIKGAGDNSIFNSSTVFTLTIFNYTTGYLLTPSVVCDTAGSDEGISLEDVTYYTNPADLNATTKTGPTSPQATPQAIDAYGVTSGAPSKSITFRVQSLYQNKNAKIILNLELQSTSTS